MLSSRVLAKLSAGLCKITINPGAPVHFILHGCVFKIFFGGGGAHREFLFVWGYDALRNVKVIHLSSSG